jgi:hypothetical protein
VLRLRPEFAAYNELGIVDTAITSLLTRAVAGDDDVISSDYSAFDASFPMQLGEACINSMVTWFSELDRHAIEWVGFGMLTSALLTPDGLTETRKGGIGSGWDWTNLFGTMGNFIASRYVAYALGVGHTGGTYLGDDAVNVYSPNPGLDEIQDAASDLNLKLNVDKQYVAKRSCHYLQRVHDLDSMDGETAKGMRPIMRALSGILNFERYRPDWDKWTKASRTLAQIVNVRNHPNYHEFKTRVLSGDPVLNLNSPSTIIRKAGGAQEVDRATGRLGFRHTTFGAKDIPALL